MREHQLHDVLGKKDSFAGGWLLDARLWVQRFLWMGIAGHRLTGWLRLRRDLWWNLDFQSLELRCVLGAEVSAGVGVRDGARGGVSRISRSAAAPVLRRRMRGGAARARRVARRFGSLA